LGKQQARGGVAQVVEPHPSQAGFSHEPLERAVVVAWVNRRSKAGREHQIAFTPTLGGELSFLLLARLPPTERHGDRGRHWDDPRGALGLGCHEREASVRLPL
jgi:hypothetical protein